MLATVKRSLTNYLKVNSESMKILDDRSVAIARRLKLDRFKTIDIIAPLGVGIFGLLAWEFIVDINQIPDYLLPSPRRVFIALIAEWGRLIPALGFTAQIAIVSLIAAVVSGVSIAILMAQSKWIERSLFPYAVLLQTMPIAAIAPLIIVLLKNNTFAALVVCAWLAAVFPIIASTTFGLNSCDRTLSRVFQLYGASPFQTLVYLRWPSALPYFLAGLRISGGLALIGAVVAEFVAGTGGRDSGIAYQILISSYNLEIPKMFAALLLTTGLGIIIFTIVSMISTLAIGHWHESNDR
jgi:NitT/TauT family transport system permease protein